MLRSTLLFFLLLQAFLAFPQEREGKERIELVRANTLEFDRSMGEDARRIIGNVRFRHGEATMDCDSAYLYSGKQKLRAFGNVHIIHNDSIHLYGDSLRYNGEDRFARLRSNVKVEDPQMTLFTDVLDYRIADSRADYREGGRLRMEESDHRLKSKKGTYFTDAQRIHFKDDVVLSHPDYKVYSDTMVHHPSQKKSDFHGPTVMRTEEEVIFCNKGWYDGEEDLAFLTDDPYVNRGASTLKADTIYFRNEEGEGRAMGRVELLDTAEDVTAYGGKGTYARDGRKFLLTKNPVLEKPFKEDTLYLRGDSIQGRRDSGTGDHTLIVHPEVRFYREDLQGRCDSMSYEERDSTIRLFHDPVLWTSEDDRIFGDTIRIRLRDGGIRSIDIPSQPFISSRKDPPYFDQMTGVRMKAFMNEEERIERIEIEGKGRTIHFPEKEEEEDEKDGGEKEESEVEKEDQEKEKEQKEKGLIGMNRTASARIKVRFNEDGMRSVSFYEEPGATLFPMEDLEDGGERLKGFLWDEKGRANSKKDITEGAWIHGRN